MSKEKLNIFMTQRNEVASLTENLKTYARLIDRCCVLTRDYNENSASEVRELTLRARSLIETVKEEHKDASFKINDQSTILDPIKKTPIVGEVIPMSDYKGQEVELCCYILSSEDLGRLSSIATIRALKEPKSAFKELLEGILKFVELEDEKARQNSYILTHIKTC